MQLFRIQLSQTIYVNVMLLDMGIEPSQQLLDTTCPVICYDRDTNKCVIYNLTPPASVGNEYEELKPYVHGVLRFAVKLFPQTKTISWT